jgi:16S rRNA (cytidine1402-2'-O)-methyltransferase
LPTLAAHYAGAGAPKGEIVIVIAPPDSGAPPVSADALDTKLASALERLSVKDAADVVAAETGVARREVYRRAVALAGSPEKRK